MPYRPKQPCGEPGCLTLTDGKRCPAHKREARRIADQRRPGERRLYDSRAWRDRIRPAKLRQDPLCEECKRSTGKLSVATDVDHIDGDTQNNSSENLRSLCHPCHSRKTAAKDGGFGRVGGGSNL